MVLLGTPRRQCWRYLWILILGYQQTDGGKGDRFCLTILLFVFNFHPYYLLVVASHVQTMKRFFLFMTWILFLWFSFFFSCSKWKKEMEAQPFDSNEKKRKKMQQRQRQRQPAGKNKEEIETQRMNHIAVERNRRRLMNDHLGVLRSIMPESYIQKVIRTVTWLLMFVLNKFCLLTFRETRRQLWVELSITWRNLSISYWHSNSRRLQL